VSLLTVVLILAMLLWAVGFVVLGLVLAERVLWGRSGGEGSPPVSSTRKGGGMLLIVIGGLMVVIAIVTGVLVAERESHLIRLAVSVSQLESKVQLLESRLREAISDPSRSQAAPR
jgi:hypothetical protein